MQLIKAESSFLLFLTDSEEVVTLPTKFINKMMMKPKYAQRSVFQYANNLKQFLIYVNRTFEQDIDTVLAELQVYHIEKYFKWMENQGKSDNTIRNHEETLKAFFNWLASEEGGYVRKKPIHLNENHLTAKPMKKMPKYRFKEDIINFINTLHDESQRCMAHFFFDTGIRVSEIEKIRYCEIPRLEDYPLEQTYFDMRLLFGSKGRGGKPKERMIIISRPMIERIHLLHSRSRLYRASARTYKEEMPLFLNVHGKPVTANSIKSLFYEACKRLKNNDEKFSPHVFRHSFAVAVLMSEFDKETMNKLFIAKEALGHNNIKTTEIYTKIPIDALITMGNGEKQFRVKYKEAEEIFDKTYKSQRDHTEKRGRKK